MRLLDRYLLRELLIPLGYCLGGFLIFWIAFDLITRMEEFQRNRLVFHDIVEYYLVVTPEFLVVGLPIALLMALLYTLTHLARHHELVAMRSAGVGVWRLCLPYLAVGFCLSLVSFALNELWVPGNAELAERIKLRRLQPAQGTASRDLVGKGAFNNSRDRRVWSWATYNLRTFEMAKPVVVSTFPGGVEEWLSAERAVRSNGVWTFLNAEVDQGTNGRLVRLFLTNVLAKAEFGESPAEIQSEISINRSMDPAVRAKSRAVVPLGELLDYLRLHPRMPDGPHRAWVYTQFYGRLAEPWQCLVVVLIAIPFGAVTGRRNVFVGVASSIFICFGYLVLMQLGLALGTGGYLPPWLAAWFPNLAFGGAGVWTTRWIR